MNQIFSLKSCVHKPLSTSSLFGSWILLSLLFFVPIWSALPFGPLESNRGTKCKFSETLKSHYVTAIDEEASNVTGCINARSNTNKYQEVHLIRLLSSGYNGPTLDGYLPTVTLNIKSALPEEDYNGNGAVILYADSPVIWHIYTENIHNSTGITIFTSHGSQAVPNIPFPLTKQVRVKSLKAKSLDKIISWSRRRLGSFNTVLKIDIANQISLKLGSPILNSKQIENCSDTRLKASENVTFVLNAIYSRPQTAGGCEVTLDAMNEDEHKTVFVIQLEPQHHAPLAVIHVAPYGSVIKSRKAVMKKSLIFVLQSPRKITWSIESWGVEGPILAYSQYPVLSERLTLQNNLTVKNQAIPSKSDQIIQFVEEKVGQIHTYIKAANANKILILLDDQTRHKIHEAHRHRLTENVVDKSMISSFDSSYPQGIPKRMTDIFNSLKNGAPTLNPSSYIINHTKIMFRDNDGLRINISLSAVKTSAKQLLGMSSIQEDALTVSLQHCSGNKSHDSFWFDVKDPRLCGSVSAVDSKSNVFEGQLMFWYRIPSRFMFPLKRSIILRGRRMLFPIGNVRLDDQESIPTNSELLFPLTFRCTGSSVEFLTHKLNIFTDQSYQQRVDFLTEPLRTRVGDQLYVDAKADETSGNGAILQDCWFSEKSAPLFPNDTSKFVLVKNGCPQGSFVSFVNQKDKDRLAISLASTLVGKSLYLHCHVQACSRNRGVLPLFENLKECASLSSDCSNPNSPRRRPSTYYTIETVGVLHVKQRETNTLQNSILGSFAEAPGIIEKINTTSKSELNQGLTTIPIFFISAASFVIGAAFVSILWFINSKTDPTKRYAKRHSHRDSCHSSASSYHQESHLNQKSPQISYGFDLCSSHSADSSPDSQQRIPFNAVSSTTAFR